MKKKAISLLLTSAMLAMALVGCGSPAETGATADSQPASTVEEAATEAAEEESAAPATEEAAADTGEAADYSGVELTYWSMWNSIEPQGQVLQEAADAFSEKTGATINIEWKGRDIKTIVMAALESGEKIDLFEDSDSNMATVYKD